MTYPANRPSDPWGSYEAPGSPPPAPWRPGPTASTALAPADERNWAVGAHLSSFVAAWLALGFLGPLVVLLVAGNRSPFVRRHAVEALNFNLSVMIYAAISALLLLALIGFVLLPALGVLYLVCTILATMAASRGAEFRYPLTLRFIR